MEHVWGQRGVPAPRGGGGVGSVCGLRGGSAHTRAGGRPPSYAGPCPSPGAEGLGVRSPVSVRQGLSVRGGRGRPRCSRSHGDVSRMRGRGMLLPPARRRSVPPHRDRARGGRGARGGLGRLRGGGRSNGKGEVAMVGLGLGDPQR